MHALTDSTIVLCWIKLKEISHEKIEKRNVFINNKLNSISELCKVKAVNFDHVEGELNPADCLTRQFSSKSVLSSNFLRGPEYSKNSEHSDNWYRIQLRWVGGITGYVNLGGHTQKSL